MPAGCDFICRNEKCEANECGFVMTAPWPLGNIALVINQGNVRLNANFREGLIRLKNEGRKHACINYPNVEEVEVEGYRVTKWCEKCNRLWQYDVMKHDDVEGFVEDLDGFIEAAHLPFECPDDGATLQSFYEAVDNGIKCPSCYESLEQSRWFSNETSEPSR